MHRRPFRLARRALALVVPIIIYASLRPFSGWRDSGRPALAFLVWPSSLGSPFDALLNVVGYVVLGLCLALALFPRWRGGAAFAVGAGVPALLSLAVETMQTYIPGRVPSVVDLGANTLGALIGAAMAVALTPWLLDQRGGRGLHQRWLASGPVAEFGLLVLAAWFVALFTQHTVLFGVGDFRGNLQVAVERGVPAIVYAGSEVFVVAANFLVASLVLRLVLAEGVSRLAPLLALIAATLAMRVVAQLALWEPGAVWAWVTPANLMGLACGAAAAWWAAHWPRRTAALAATALLAMSLLVVNSTPPDPAWWLERTAPREHVLIGLVLVARYTAKAWPLAAALFLCLTWRRARTRA